MRIRSFAVCLLCSVAVAGAQPFSGSLFDRLEWRLIGPFRAGRVVAVAGIPGDPNTFYFGAVGGGVWKTTDAGTVWTPVFDQQRIASIGAIAVAPSNPNVIYVGTGETDIRSDLGIGDGVYKSVDGGKTWRNIGLRDSRQIGSIRVDPRNPDTVYVAALGHAYGPNAERGVYRSTDGGVTWRKVLDKGPEIGAVDLALEPENPRAIYATVWNAHRPPWSVYGPIEGPGSGLYKSTDAGDHWIQLAGHGLPEGDWRRSGVATAAGGRVYVLIDAQSGGGLYRSDDAGQSWTHTSADTRIVSRGWYFGGVTADPKNPDTVYVPNVALYRSSDGGKTFTVLKGAPGGDDYHILWIDPSEPRRMLLGSDQGTNVSVDGGATWSTWYNQATAQFYHVITDNRFPYFVYGSQQDSGTAAVASRTDHGQIDARDWFSVGGAESGYIAIDQRDPNIFYVGNTNGSLTRFDKRTGQAQNITPSLERGGFGPNADISQQKYRFPWTAPLVTSSTEPDTLYYGSQYLLKTTDGGLTWHEISPDLTGNPRGVLYSIAPSPLKAGMVWTGSDTGLIHLTRDGGKTWENVTPKGLPEWSNVTHIEASHFDRGGGVRRGGPAPTGRLQAVRVSHARLRQDVDAGGRGPRGAGVSERHSRRSGAERTAVRGHRVGRRCFLRRWRPLAIAPTQPAGELGARPGDPRRRPGGGDARARVLDSRRHLAAAADRRPGGLGGGLALPAGHGHPHESGVLHRDAISSGRTQGEESAGGGDSGLLPQIGAGRRGGPGNPGQPEPGDTALFQQRSRGGAETARGDCGYLDRASAAPHGKAGMNRFAWDLRYAPPGADGGADSEFGRPAQGPQVLPGTYTARLTVAGRSYTQPLKVALDPRSVATPEDLSKQLELGLSASRAIGQAAETMREVRALRSQLAQRRQAAEASSNAALVSKIAALDAEAARISLSATSSELGSALSVAESADRTPPATAYQIYDQASRALAAQVASWKSLLETKLGELNRELVQNRLAAIEAGVH